MVWRGDTREIYVLYDDGRYESYEDTWQEGDPVYIQDTPPPGLLAPVRGFGHLYASQPLLRESVGRELEQNIERRRSRILGRILDLAPRIQLEGDLERIPDALGVVLTNVFPECRHLILVFDPMPPSDVSDLKVGGHALEDTEVETILPVVEQVARAGLPAYTSDFALDFEGLSSCVPIQLDDVSYGAIYVAMPHGLVATSEELAGYLRRIAGVAAVGFRYGCDLKELRQDGELIATETGTRLAASTVSLSAAKRSFERWLIQVRLKESRGNIAAAARKLQMDRGQLSRLVKRHAIDKQGFKPSRD